jgi:hypothetical protein
MMSGVTYPEQWEIGTLVRQDFTLPLPIPMATGVYRVKIAVKRAAYIPNRTIRDYFINEDSLDGTPVAEIRIVAPHARTPVARDRRGGDGSDASDD